MVGISTGTVMYHMIFQRDAPSIFAASYGETSADAMAAMYKIEANPVFFHISLKTRKNRYSTGSVRNSTSSPPSAVMISFTMPVSPPDASTLLNTPAKITHDKKFGRYKIV